MLAEFVEQFLVVDEENGRYQVRQQPCAFLGEDNCCTVYEVRRSLGTRLAEEHPAEADLVIPVPDSGVPSAIGYASTLGIPFEMGLIRSHYVGRTFIEPVVASFIVAIPTTFFLVDSETVRTLPTFLYVIMAAIGILFTLIGAYIGERIQLGPPPKAVD